MVFIKVTLLLGLTFTIGGWGLFAQPMIKLQGVPPEFAVELTAAIAGKIPKNVSLDITFGNSRPLFKVSASDMSEGVELYFSHNIGALLYQFYIPNASLQAYQTAIVQIIVSIAESDFGMINNRQVPWVQSVLRKIFTHISASKDDEYRKMLYTASLLCFSEIDPHIMRIVFLESTEDSIPSSISPTNDGIPEILNLPYSSPPASHFYLEYSSLLRIRQRIQDDMLIYWGDENFPSKIGLTDALGAKEISQNLVVVENRSSSELFVYWTNSK